MRRVRPMPRWSRSIWRNWAFVLSIWLVIAGIGGVQVGGQEPLGDELVEAVTSPNETFVGVFPSPLRSACCLLREAFPARAPPLVGAYPFLGAINVSDVGELAPQSVQATRGLQFGARCGGLADTAIRVEGTALNARGRPDVGVFNCLCIRLLV